jgi:hypothetical protein
VVDWGHNLDRALLDALGESLKLRGFDVEEPLEVRAHFALHLIYSVEVCPTIHHDLLE